MTAGLVAQAVESVLWGSRWSLLVAGAALGATRLFLAIAAFGWLCSTVLGGALGLASGYLFAKLETELQSQGMKVRQIKVENGCYEVYATDKAGKRANMAFNAETLEKLDNAEAGEN